MATFTVNVPRTYTEGWGVAFTAIWDEDTDNVSDVESVVLELNARTVWTVDGLPCVADQDGSLYSVSDFRELDDLNVGDTHDLRNRWFATEAEAREHERYTMNRYRNPAVWESFIQFV